MPAEFGVDPNVIQLTGLNIFPVKGLRGSAVTTAEVDPLGLVGDRRFMLVDQYGRFLTQRTLRDMARIGTALTPDELILSLEGRSPVTLRRAPDPLARRLRVSVWKSEGLEAEDCGDEVAAWLGEFLKLECRLVRIGPDFHRPSLKSDAQPGDLVSFADSHPFLVISEESPAELNDRLVAQGEEAVPMDRFRANLVVRGGAAFAEDTWKRFRIGAVTFRTGGPCARCVVTTTDQKTGARGPEPLRTLATFRRDPNDPTDVNFGQNVIHETKNGTLRVGDPLVFAPQKPS